MLVPHALKSWYGTQVCSLNIDTTFCEGIIMVFFYQLIKMAIIVLNPRRMGVTVSFFEF